MISRSNYIAITLIMCIVLLMFQLTGISENVLMNDGENIYAQEAVPEEQVAPEQQSYEDQMDQRALATATRECVGLIGDPSEECLEIGRDWSVLQKKDYCYYGNLGEAAADVSGAGFLIVDGTTLGETDVEALRTLADQGRHVVVSGLPDSRLLDTNRALRQSLGILEIVEDEITVDGFKLFGGFMLGGETIYDDYAQEMPYARLDDSVTAYAVAQSEDAWLQELDNEDLPAIIWRYAPDVGKVYVVNGDYLTGQMGAGLLTGFAADTESVYLYPVVNAQVSVVENYPTLADENKDYMEREYGQNSSIVFRDILWPSIVAIYFDTDDVMTVTGAFRLDYDDREKLDENLLRFYYEQVTKESGEIGLSGYQVSDVPLEEKLEEDLDFLEEVLPNYEILTFQAGDLEEAQYASLVGEGNLLEDVNTVLENYREDDGETFFEYLDNGVLKLPIYMDSRVMENEDDFRSRCLQTAYGYYGTGIDTSRVIYPDSEDDSWNIMSNDWSKNYRPYRTPFVCFEKTTASEADRRVRNYLALDYETSVEGEQMRITADAPDGDCYFILRLHGQEIEEMTGGSYEKIENGWYLLTLTEDTVELTLTQTEHAHYYIESGD